MLKVYGADICIDCRNYKEIKEKRGFEAEYIDIISHNNIKKRQKKIQTIEYYNDIKKKGKGSNI